jgi:SAM-dependent methyltransferase
VLPERFAYRQADLDCAPIPFANDSFDLVVAAHVIEHLRRPVEAVAECVWVCRPGGRIYVEAPSERSTWLPGMPFWRDDLRSLSFYDDPTHVGRPWTPQALHRLARYLGCEPEEVRHLSSWQVRLALPLLLAGAIVRHRTDIFGWAIWNAVGWASCAVIRKPDSLIGSPQLTNYTRQH